MDDRINLTAVIALTPFLAGDEPNLVRYLNEPAIAANTLMIPSPYSEQDARDWIALTQKNADQYGRYTNWAIRHAEMGLIGGIGRMVQTGLEGHRDEIGYWLAAPFRGQGIMPLAIAAFVQQLFKEGLIKITANVFIHNRASARALEKVGFVSEGVLKQHYYKNGVYLDALAYALFKPTANVI
jgi:RimJ/RimL family protein N-acetyltransferase